MHFMLLMRCRHRTLLTHVAIFEPNPAWLTVVVVVQRGEGRLEPKETLGTLNTQVVRAKEVPRDLCGFPKCYPAWIYGLSGSLRAASSTHVRLQAPGHADYINTDPIGSPGSNGPERRA